MCALPIWEAGAIRTRRIHRYHHGTRPQMKRACLSETHTPVARQVTQGLEAQGWNVRLRTEGPAPDLRVDFLKAASSRLGSTGKADCSSLILVAPAAGRMALAALSLHTQQLAVDRKSTSLNSS